MEKKEMTNNVHTNISLLFKENITIKTNWKQKYYSYAYFRHLHNLFGISIRNGVNNALCNTLLLVFLHCTSVVHKPTSPRFVFQDSPS